MMKNALGVAASQFSDHHQSWMTTTAWPIMHVGDCAVELEADYWSYRSPAIAYK